MKSRLCAIGVCSILAICCGLASAQATKASPATQPTAKERYLPAEIWNVPKGNDFANTDSEFSFKRMAESENFAIFWSKSLGDDLSTHADPKKRVDVQFALKECERFYDFYVNQMKFVRKGQSVTDRYKTLFFIVGGDDGTAYGGGEDEKVGILWSPPVRISKPPYGAIAHELGHCFQYLVHADGSSAFTASPRGGGQTIFEMTSQWMLWQVYPEWIRFENYHLVDFLKQTHYAFLHEKNQYHSPFVLEYWSGKHGIEFIGNIWREAKAGEDAVMAYKRLTGIDQATFNDEMFDAARRFITWDLARIEKVSAPYANQHTSELTKKDDGWYQIAESRCPQNYGYNGIKLVVPEAGTNLTLQFKGIAGAEGFRAIDVAKAGWRYGFVAVKEDGSRLYSEAFSAAEGSAQFVVLEHISHLWLVVLGAPTEHWSHIPDGKDENDEQWPYQFKLTGTTPDASNLR